MAYYAERLANGNTLVAGGKGHDVQEFDADGNVVWHFEEKDFPPKSHSEWIVGAYRLENGNTMIVNWLGHGKRGKGLSILETTPDKKILWTCKEPRTMNFVRIIK